MYQIKLIECLSNCLDRPDIRFFSRISPGVFNHIFSLSDYESAAEAAEATDTDNDLSFEGERERERMLFMFWFVFPVQVLGFQSESSAEFLIYWRISTSRTTPRTLRPRWRVSSYRSVGSVGTHLCSSVMSHFANILRDFHHHMCLFIEIKLSWGWDLVNNTTQSHVVAGTLRGFGVIKTNKAATTRSWSVSAALVRPVFAQWVLNHENISNITVTAITVCLRLWPSTRMSFFKRKFLKIFKRKQKVNDLIIQIIIHL